MTKLFAIFAAQAPVAVILRRGPTSWYHVIRWDTERDAFEHGAWIKGRIYPEKCDVSPGGELFVYAAMQGSRGRTDFTHSFTAVSRVPWLKALVVWPFGTTYDGGGRFYGERILAVRFLWHEKTGTLPDFPADGLQVVDRPTPYHERLAHDIDADWCGRDQRNRLCFSIGGKLYRQEIGEDRLIADFEDLVLDPQPAPEWAGHPLVARRLLRRSVTDRSRRSELRAWAQARPKPAD